MSIKSIITLITELRKPCELVKEKEDVSQIITDLHDTLNAHPEGWGLSANQIGYNKRISIVKIPKKIDQKTKKIEYNEFILINAKILEKIGKSSRTIGEGCLSFPGIKIDTERHLAILVEYLDEKLEKQTAMFQREEALAVQHETDHNSGITIFNRKWRAR